jgi:GNAT superfamily N-acetyltransferase
LSDPIPTLKIRSAGLADRPAIVEFNRCLALETEGKQLDPITLDAGVLRALHDPDRLRYWVAEIGSSARLVGQAAITREWSDWRNGWIWWVQSVYIAQPYRGRGIFRALFGQIHQEARANSDVIGVRLYVEDSNEPAQHVYRALGMNPGGYSIYEELWIDRLHNRSGTM